MARVTHVKRAKNQGRCEACGDPIPAGSAYKWAKSFRGPKRTRHEACPDWRPSELTGSNALSIAYAAQESADDALGAWDGESKDDLETILNDLAEGLREGAEAYRESATNIEDGFGHATYQSDELNEFADTLESSADTVEGEADQLEDWDEDQNREDVLAKNGIEPYSYDWDADADGLQGEVDARKEAWAEEMRGIVSDAVSGVEFP